jgi:hypothetical protein
MWQAQMRLRDGTREPTRTDEGSRAIVIDAARWFSQRTGIPVLIRDDKGKAIGLQKWVS